MKAINLQDLLCIFIVNNEYCEIITQILERT